MMDAALLAAFQLGDSALPIGRFGHSLGLESLLADDPDANEGVIVEIIETIVVESVGPLDGVAVAHAHRAASKDDLAALLRLDRAVTARKLTTASRIASTSCGRGLAALLPVLTEAAVAQKLAGRVIDGTTDGNLPVVEGALAHGVGIDCLTAVLLDLRSAAATLLSVSVRLGRLSVSRSQAALVHLHAPIARAARDALETQLDEMRSVALEAEVASMTHRRRDARLFMT
jgi:urease accessory protein